MSSYTSRPKKGLAEIAEVDLPSTGSSPRNRNEDNVFRHITRPDDSYTEDGIYWADLPFRQRLAFIHRVDAAEARSEWSTIKEMFRGRPLSPLTWYCKNALIPGAGLWLEGYVLFSIGNLEPLFKAVWPSCWGEHPTVCDKSWLTGVTYMEIVGMMAGMMTVGIVGDWVGRRWGLIQDAAIMTLGLAMLTAMWGFTLEGWIILYGWSLFVYAFGLGGEHPITVTSSLENAVASGKISAREDRLHRGRRVTMAFSMQGWGQLTNQVLLIAMLLAFNKGNPDPPYKSIVAQGVFRISFAVPLIGTVWLTWYRIFRMKEASKHLDEAKSKNNVTGYDVQSLQLTMKYFSSRLIATAGSWFCSDVFFYGNKLFQAQFISVISDTNSLMTVWKWNLVNIFVSIAGYYCATLLIDHREYGRKNMQWVGFAVSFIMFIIPAFNYKHFTSPVGIKAFQAMYFISSFFIQFGPNCVTFLAAGEVFPTQIRASAHGFCSFSGKIGALVAAVMYSYVDTQTKFYVVPWFGLTGALLTYIWLPDTTGLDLAEQERRWQYILEGREKEYHGIAVHPRHLSLWERMRDVHKQYEPRKDAQAKIEEVRREWLNRHADVSEKDFGIFHADEEITQDVHRYFRRLHTRVLSA